ncbi:Tat pathway signal protein [Phenylobacterium sp.]|uniref:Acg family FMN-binding oxidoreductase n=1 Tax=Phenylobacterium sp. TaxID=1871053 RepID=UPI0027312DED|nr:Tat pathway signal protein [Phenylobacterium sp.]MDP2213513.1 Tat pathway signal protein [Phenylobacterium sp.]
MGRYGSQSSGLNRRVAALGLLGIAAAPLAACAGASNEAAEAAAALRRPLDLDAADPIPELVRFATLAANGHNTQPWRFDRTEGGVMLAADDTRRTPVVDPDDHHLYASLGCAAENLMTAASAYGLGATYGFDPDTTHLRVDLAPANRPTDPFVAAIPKRQCTRSDFSGAVVAPGDLALLQAAAKIDGVDILLITDRAGIDRVRDAVIEGNRRQMQDEAFVGELKQWIRFDRATAVGSGDGLFAPCSGNPTLPDPIGQAIFPMVFTIDGETKKYRAQMDTSAGVAVFSAAQDDPRHWAQAGRAYQRFALQATLLGIKHAFVNQPVEVAAMRPQFSEAVGLGGRRVDLVVRFGYAPDLPFSLRRPVNAVLAA